MLPIEIRESDAVSLLSKIIKSGKPNKTQFYILLEYLQSFTLDQLVEKYYTTHTSYMMRISIPLILTDFRPAEENEELTNLNEQTWEFVKKTISQKVNEYLK